MPDPISPALPPVSDDTLFAGRLHCRQSTEGYRFSVDAVLAAHFVAIQPGQRALDLGCGCGIIGLILAHRHPQISVVGLELQEELAQLAVANGQRNNFSPRFAVIRGDVRTIAEVVPAESANVVVCNPPYRRAQSGRINGSLQAAVARHELRGTLDDFVRAAAHAVKNRGRTVFVYPARRAATLLATLQTHHLVPKRLQPVYSSPQAASACLVLVEALKNGGEQLDFLAPFYLYTRTRGQQSAELQALYQEAACWPR